MKVIMEVQIIKPQGGPRPAPRLEVDLPFTPYVGMPVWHVAWKDSRKVEVVQLDLNDEPFLIVTLEPEEAGNADEQKQVVEQYKGHGWTVPS